MKLGDMVGQSEKALSKTEIKKFIGAIKAHLAKRGVDVSGFDARVSVTKDSGRGIFGERTSSNTVNIAVDWPGVRWKGGSTYTNIGKISIGVFNSLGYKDYDTCMAARDKKPRPPFDTESYNARVGTDGRMREYRRRWWHCHEPRNHFHYDTDLEVLGVECAENILETMRLMGREAL